MSPGDIPNPPTGANNWQPMAFNPQTGLELRRVEEMVAEAVPVPFTPVPRGSGFSTQPSRYSTPT